MQSLFMQSLFNISLPSNPTQSFEKLTMEFEKYKLYIVERGELECFAKSVGNHGPKWVNEVLKKDLVNDKELSEAREFVKKIII